MASKETVINEDFLDGDEDNHDDPSSLLSKSSNSNGRDEVKEIQNVQKKENNRILLWRVLLSFALLATGVVVTVTTYMALVNEEQNKFVDAVRKFKWPVLCLFFCSTSAQLIFLSPKIPYFQFEQFSRTVADAAIEKQQAIRDGVHSFSNIVTSSALAANATWPLFALPDIEVHMMDLFQSTGTEVASVANIVMDKDKAVWEDFVVEGHESWLEEAHMHHTGNMDSFSPVGFSPNVTALTAKGFVPQNRSDFYVPVWSYSPPYVTWLYYCIVRATTTTHTSIIVMSDLSITSFWMPI